MLGRTVSRSRIVQRPGAVREQRDGDIWRATLKQ
jgi:hypothetical protein